VRARRSHNNTIFICYYCYNRVTRSYLLFISFSELPLHSLTTFLLFGLLAWILLLLLTSTATSLSTTTISFLVNLIEIYPQLNYPIIESCHNHYCFIVFLWISLQIWFFIIYPKGCGTHQHTRFLSSWILTHIAARTTIIKNTHCFEVPSCEMKE